MNSKLNALKLSYTNYSGNPGKYWNEVILIGDTLYFDAISTGSWEQNKYELHAFDTSNQTLWQITNSTSSYPISSPGNGDVRDTLPKVIGDTIFFAYDDGLTGKELWAHNGLNGTTWQVIDLNTGQNYNNSNPGEKLAKVVDEVLYFSAADGNTHLWAHNPSNGSTWKTSSDVRFVCSPGGAIRCQNVVSNGIIYFQGIEVPPKGVIYDTANDIIKNLKLIKAQAIDSEIMPPNNLTGITNEERQKLRIWIEQGANTNN
mgnify:CR=1 FL=1